MKNCMFVFKISVLVVTLSCFCFGQAISRSRFVPQSCDPDVIEMFAEIDLSQQEIRLWLLLEAKPRSIEERLLSDFLDHGGDGDWRKISEPKNLKKEARPIFWSLIRKRLAQIPEELEQQKATEFFEPEVRPNFDKEITDWLKDKPPMIPHPDAGRLPKRI